MVKLYVLKCDGGYVRSNSLRECSCVGIDKASVFNENNLMEPEALTQRAVMEGINNVCLVELKVIEKLDAAREDCLYQSLYKMLEEKQGGQAEDRKKWEDILLTKLHLLGENDFVVLAKQVRTKKLQPL